MHAKMLDTSCHIDLELFLLEMTVGIYEFQSIRVDRITNQADKPKILEVMESCLLLKAQFTVMYFLYCSLRVPGG